MQNDSNFTISGLFFVYNLETKKVSKKSWKTHKGALKNCKQFDQTVTASGIDWLNRHPEYIEEHLQWLKNRINK